MKSLSRVSLFATPWTVAHQAPPSSEFSRQEYWSGLPFPSPADLPDPGIEPGSPALQADALPSEPPGKPNMPILGQNCESPVPTALVGDGAHISLGNDSFTPRISHLLFVLRIPHSLRGLEGVGQLFWETLQGA